MPRTSLIDFRGDDYDLVCCFGAFFEYCVRCAEKSITVDLLCPNSKYCWKIFDEFKIFEKVIINEQFIDDDEYYFTRVIEKSVPSYMVSMKYERYIRKILGLEHNRYLFWSRNEIETLFCRNIKYAYSKRAFNIVNIDDSFYEKNIMDVNISVINISGDSPSISIGSKNIKSTLNFKLNGILQLVVLIATSNVYIGQDSIASQIAINIGVPCFILTSSNGRCKIKQDSPNIIYSRRCNVTPITAQKLIGIWETLDSFY